MYHRSRIIVTHRDALEAQLAVMMDVSGIVKLIYDMEGDRLEILLVFDRLQMLRSIGNSLRTKQDGLLPNVDAVLRVLMELKPGVQFEKRAAGYTRRR